MNKLIKLRKKTEEIISVEKSPKFVVDNSNLFESKNGVLLNPIQRAKKIFSFLKFIGKIE